MKEEQLPTSSNANESEQKEKHLRTLAVRLDEGLHARLSFIAQLRGSSLAEEIRRAIESRIEAVQEDPEFIERAELVRNEIEREAAARSAAIAGFLGKPAVSAAVESGEASSTKTRRPNQTTNE